MTGERMTKLYVAACLGRKPEFKTEEEKRFYDDLVKEIEESEATTGEFVHWVIPSE
jgi:polyhydroxyalkanoate synthesis regulator phasin